MKYFLLIFIALFTACSTKNYKKIESKIIIIQSPKLKFADLGYLRSSDTDIQLELFIAGRSIQKIEINHLICVNEGCMSKSGFNEEYLNAEYPSKLLQNVLLGRAIYGAKERKKTQDGFTQNIKTQNVDITYRVTDNTIFFKDRKNRIIFKIKDTQ